MPPCIKSSIFGHISKRLEQPLYSSNLFISIRFQLGTPAKLVTFWLLHSLQIASSFLLKSPIRALLREGVRKDSTSAGELLSSMAERSPLLACPPSSPST